MFPEGAPHEVKIADITRLGLFVSGPVRSTREQPTRRPMRFYRPDGSSPTARSIEWLRRQMATLSVRCCRWGQTPYEGVICEYM
ncbi:MAG: hypothetical protein KBI46_11385 [Phycisphaerae bacterium]|nr:hypothetical protein [Phycisphaerae bacterium]